MLGNFFSFNPQSQETIDMLLKLLKILFLVPMSLVSGFSSSSFSAYMMSCNDSKYLKPHFFNKPERAKASLESTVYF